MSDGRIRGSDGVTAGKLKDSSTRVFYYLLDTSLRNPDLFTTVLDYFHRKKCILN